MDDVISLSSAEEDSEVEFVGSYNNEREDSVPFIRAELLAVTPVLIDITGHKFPSLRPRHSRRSSSEQNSPVEIIDLNSYCLHNDSSDSYALKRVVAQGRTETGNSTVESSINTGTKLCGKSRRSSRRKNVESDPICLDSGDGDGCLSAVSLDQDKDSADQYDSFYSHLEKVRTGKKSGNVFHHDQSEIRASAHSDALHNSPAKKLQDSGVVEEQQNTTYAQKTFEHNTELHTEYNENWDSTQSWFDRDPSPFSLDSPYYCPSEVDLVIFSEESNVGDNTSEFPSNTNKETTNEHEPSSPIPQAQSELPGKALSTSCGASPASTLPCEQLCSPTSTEILAGDSPDTMTDWPTDLAMESPPYSPFLRSPSPPFSSTETLPFTSTDTQGLTSSDCPPCSSCASPGKDDNDPSESHRQHISLVQFKKLKHSIGGGVQDVPEEEEEARCPTDPLCRQSLSLVYSTIEEHYPEGTLQLLSDFIQPRYYPPRDITAHLLRGILLDPQSSQVLALEAYNLLMRTQKYHPADISSVPWDWELLSSVMSEQDEILQIRSKVRWLLFRYVLQVLEDDFQFKLPMKKLQLSIAKAILSCDEKFRQVRDLLTWLLDTAKQSFCNSEDDELQNQDQKSCLKILLILQRMLLLAMEVDRRPTCSANKLSQELKNSLNSTAPCRQLRLLLLSTLESNLLRCKLLELLLDQACSEKRPLPMSFKLLLHFLQTSTLAPDPSDGTERWRRWDELLQLVWMLMLSYEEVMTGHLRFAITERFTLSRAPMWTQNDQVTRAAVQEAAEAFLSRALEDLGHALPSQIQESLSQLQEHLLSICLH